MTYTTAGSTRELTVTLAYLQYDSDEPPPGLREVTDYCSRSKMQLIIGHDANAYHLYREARH
jgi:hypothetical protein